MSQPLHQNPLNGDRFVCIDTYIDEQLRARQALAVGTEQHGRIGIVNPGQADGALKALQQFEVDPRRFAHVTGSDVKLFRVNPIQR
jgi:hypothetical protein